MKKWEDTTSGRSLRVELMLFVTKWVRRVGSYTTHFKVAGSYGVPKRVGARRQVKGVTTCFTLGSERHDDIYIDDYLVERLGKGGRSIWYDTDLDGAQPAVVEGDEESQVGLEEGI
jgi:hypothetical protein